jgi:hypothetical protein
MATGFACALPFNDASLSFLYVPVLLSWLGHISTLQDMYLNA